MHQEHVSDEILSKSRTQVLIKGNNIEFVITVHCYKLALILIRRDRFSVIYLRRYCEVQRSLQTALSFAMANGSRTK